jgi:hypothetical protein
MFMIVLEMKSKKNKKRKDFKDQSAVGSSTLFFRKQVSLFRLYPTQYPFTVVYESKLETSNTALYHNGIPYLTFLLVWKKVF